jgi:adenosylcobyric acid synthase
VFGCYLHGLFHNEAFRQGLLANVAEARGKRYLPTAAEPADASFDRLAEALRSSLNMDVLHEIAGVTR